MRFIYVIAIIIGCGGAGVNCKSTSSIELTEDIETGKTYRLMYNGLPWDQARLKCMEQGGKLAVPKTEEEFKFLQQNIVRRMQYKKITGTDYKLAVWIGINNMDDYTKWINVDGEDINVTGFHQWAGHNAMSNNPAEPHCAIMDAHNFGIRDFWCHRGQPYICEFPPNTDNETTISTTIKTPSN